MSFDSDISRRRFIAGTGAAIGSFAMSPRLSRAATENWAETVKAAEQEGKVSLFGPPINEYRQSIFEFQKAYPNIKLEYTGAITSEVEAKIRSERRANMYLWDLIIAGPSGPVYTEQLAQGWYDPIRPLIVNPELLDDANWIGGFEAGFLDKEKKYFFAYQIQWQSNLNIDRGVIPESELSSLEHLLDPKWKGKIVLLEPRQRGAGTNIVALILKVLGEEKTRWFLEKQEPVVAKTPRQIGEWAVRGSYPITIGLSPSELALFQAQGLGLNIKPLVLPTEQTVWNCGWGVVSLYHNAPHPNATKVFLNWMLSKEAQIDWAVRGRNNSRRRGIAPGLPAAAISEEVFLKGLSFAKEENADLVLRALRLNQDVFK